MVRTGKWTWLAAVAVAAAGLLPATRAGEKDKDKDVLDVAKASGKFTTFLKAVETTGLTKTLKDKGPYTVFAPTDDAFAKLPKGQLDDLFKEKDHKTLTEIVKLHIAPGKVGTRDMGGKTGRMKSLQGEDLQLPILMNVVEVNFKGKIVLPDVAASNGVIHGIDQVLMPGDDGKK